MDGARSKAAAGWSPIGGLPAYTLLDICGLRARANVLVTRSGKRWLVHLIRHVCCLIGGEGIRRFTSPTPMLQPLRNDAHDQIRTGLRKN
jgi:hypothetical protein